MSDVNLFHKYLLTYSKLIYFGFWHWQINLKITYVHICGELQVLWSFFKCWFQSYCGLLLKNLNFGQKFMSGHSIAEHLKFIEKRDNKSVKKQGVKNKIYKTLFFFQNNNKSTITKMLLHFQQINSNWIDTFAFLKSSLEMILLSYYLQKISLPF